MKKLTNLSSPVFLALAGLTFVFFTFNPPHIPNAQDPGTQAAIFTNATVTTTVQSSVVACGQGAGSVGRKTLAVDNETGGGVITVTAELRDRSVGSNFTSGYLAVNSLAAGSLSSATVDNTAAAGRFCQVSAVSASTSTITVTLRRE